MDIKEHILGLFPEERNQIESDFHWDKVQWYYNFLEEFNETGGFFSHRDSLQFLDRHLGESIYHVYYLVHHANVSRETHICDVGTGPGLPGFLFFCLLNAPEITLLDSQRKRMQLLENQLKHSKWDSSRIHFIYDRAENIRKTFPLVISRSFIPYPFSAEVCTKMVKKNGYYIPFLGQKETDPNLEKDILLHNGYTLEKTVELKNLSFLGKRHIKLLKKTKLPDQNYPRPWKVITKEIQKING